MSIPEQVSSSNSNSRHRIDWSRSCHQSVLVNYNESINGFEMQLLLELRPMITSSSVVVVVAGILAADKHTYVSNQVMRVCHLTTTGGKLTAICECFKFWCISLALKHYIAESRSPPSLQLFTAVTRVEFSVTLISDFFFFKSYFFFVSFSSIIIVVMALSGQKRVKTRGNVKI